MGPLFLPRLLCFGRIWLGNLRLIARRGKRIAVICLSLLGLMEHRAGLGNAGKATVSNKPFIKRLFLTLYSVRNLYYQFRVFATAEQGFVVVAPDFAGLGLNQDGQGNFIPYQYLANSASGNDVLYAVKAAREAWDVLGKRYGIMGHSKGGGAAWGAAAVLARNNGSDVDDDLREGYLGTIAAAPHVSFETTTRIRPSR